MKKTIRDIDVNGKRCLVRVDYNVPMNAELKIVDDTRIVATLPTINYLVDHGAKVILCSHLGRPNGQVDTKLSLRPVLARLSKLLNKPISFAEDVLDKSTVEMVDRMQNGDILMLENIRFYKEEDKNDPKFAKKLADLADIYVFEAFATAHRKHASTFGVASLLPSVIGFLVEQELQVFDKVLNNPEHPFVAILGGAKVVDKLPVIENLLDKVDYVLIGGGMAYTFIKAIGGNIGMSIIDNTKLDLAKEILDKAKEKGVKIMLPIDNVGAKEFSEDAETKLFNSGFFADDYQGMDIGPKTIKIYKKIIKKARTIVWNGPLGVYEYEKFKKGTNKIAKYVAKSKAISLIGGGDSIAAIQSLGVAKKVTHLSTGGGASLMLLQGKKLPCVELIEDI
ncbi:MAG TPA: phosphoglycerate kinase [Candidatus Onthoplasma faecigallinarum]|nr:phosphoglycerate kinase [Candidatus Onthoplasma faecigallinarum]